MLSYAFEHAIYEYGKVLTCQEQDYSCITLRMSYVLSQDVSIAHVTKIEYKTGEKMSDEKARPLNEFELSEMFDEINKEHFKGKINKINVVWNKRLRTCAGKCFYRSDLKHFNFGFVNKNMISYVPFKIELAYNVFKVNDWDKEKIYNTLAHEMTHAFLVQEYNERGHTQRFQNIMTRITGTRKNHRCHNYKTIKNKKSVDIICSSCGHIGTRTRMPKAGIIYKHTFCGGKIIFKKNNDGGTGFIKI